MTNCKQCAGEMAGYNTHCIDCCARLVMSTGRKNGDASRDQCITLHRDAMFYAIERSGTRIKRQQIVDEIKRKESDNSVNKQKVMV